MKFKRLFAWLLVLIMCFTLAACHNADSDSNTKTSSAETTINTEATTEYVPDTTAIVPDSESATPLLYKVSDKSGNVIWLFGSIHVGREDYYPLPSYVSDAFDNADSLAVEADIVAFEKDLDLQVQAILPLVYTDGSTIKDHLSAELYERSVEVLGELDIYFQTMDYYCPSMWSSLIDSMVIEEIGVDSNLGIDRHLIEKANSSGKEIIEIESVEFQYKLLADFSDELQALLLESSIDMYENPDEAKEDINEMLDLWASGDEKAFAAYLAESDEDMTAEEELLNEEYNNAMIVERNLTMTDFAEDALNSGEEVFICVGSAHVVGEGAMAEMLSQRGYTVECITE